ncbi:MAG: MATE family efflux transporter [Clostridium sp.]|nr:MATE family efflux transporter [Clostridium sp.]MDU7083771.1 MATE family efflux transporter [Clostridium sp.]
MEKQKSINLTEGPIASSLIKLSLPIMGTSFIQMAYNLTDMIFIGKKGSDAVAAVGTAGFFTWFAVAVILLSKAGAQIKVAQSIGMKNEEETKNYIKTSIQLNVILALAYIGAIWLFHNQMIGFFRLGSEVVIAYTKQYLLIVSTGLVCFSINPLLTAILTASGDSHTPFIINSIALGVNIVLDYVLISGIGPFPELSVAGAAIATVTAQVVGTLCFIGVIIKRKDKRFKQNYLSKLDFEHVKTITKLGAPVALQEGLFSIFSMTLARLIAPFGSVAIAVQKVGSQIESISWMTAEGFSASLSAYVGQNYGARKYDRIKKGYKITMMLACSIGIFATLFLILGRDFLISIFINEPQAIAMGSDYLIILGLSQIFMCMEITTAGAFNGMGRTEIPSFVGITLTCARIPMAMALASIPLLGINGVWWSISISSILKGIVLCSIFYIFIKKKKYVIN